MTVPSAAPTIPAPMPAGMATSLGFSSSGPVLYATATAVPAPTRAPRIPPPIAHLPHSRGWLRLAQPETATTAVNATKTLASEEPRLDFRRIYSPSHAAKLTDCRFANSIGHTGVRGQSRL